MASRTINELKGARNSVSGDENAATAAAAATAATVATAAAPPVILLKAENRRNQCPWGIMWSAIPVTLI